MIYFIDTTRGLKKATTRYAIITAKKVWKLLQNRITVNEEGIYRRL